MNFVIGFDLDHTLYDRVEIYRKVFKTMEERIPTGLPFDTIYPVYQAYSESEYELFIQGLKSKEAYQLDRLLQAYDDFGFDLEREDAQFFLDEYQKEKDRLVLRPYVEALFKQLRDKQVEMFLLTNGASKDQRHKIKALNLEQWFPEDCIFVSDEVGYSKPDPNIYKYIQRHFGEDKKLYYVGDCFYNDIEAAQSQGWGTIFFQTDLNKQWGEQGDYSIACFAELTAVLDELQRA